MAAAGIAGSKAEPDSEDAGELKSKLWNNETFDAWNENYSTNVTSVYFTTVGFLPLLQSAVRKYGHGHSSVITISSMSGIMRHAQGHFSYNTAKGATVQLSKLMGHEFLKAGIRVNSIAPGYFPSEMTAKSSGPDQKSELDQAFVESKGHVPINRPGADEDIAQTIVRAPVVAYQARIMADQESFFSRKTHMLQEKLSQSMAVS